MRGTTQVEAKIRKDKTINSKRLILLLPVAATAVALLFLSWPRLQSSLAYLPVEAALDRQWQGEPIPAGRFPDLIQSATRSAELHDDVRYREGLSLLHYLHARALGSASEEGRASLRLAGQATAAALQRAPARPALWLRMAWIRSALQAPANQVTDSLLMSILSGRVATRLYSSRLVLGLQYLDHLEQDSLRLLRDQAVLAWNYRWREVVELLVADARRVPGMRRLLEEDNPEILQEMEERLEKAR